MSEKIILGTVQFGAKYGIANKIGKPTATQVFEMLNFANRQGITTLDTAHAYGNAQNILGNFIRRTGNNFLINTKFQYSNQDLENQLTVTLDMLNIESVNVYFYHSFADFTNFPILVEKLLELKQKSKIQNIGLSVYNNSEFKIAIESEWVDVIQIPFSLLDNNTQRGYLISLAKSKGKEIQARSIFLQGLFFKEIDEIPKNLKPLMPYLRIINKVARDHKISIEQLALCYALQHNEIDYTIIGVDSLDQLKRNLETSKMTVSKDAITAIDLINVKETELLYPKNWA